MGNADITTSEADSRSRASCFAFHKDLTCSEQALAGTKLRRDAAPLYAANGNPRQVQRQGVQCIEWITWLIRVLGFQAWSDQTMDDNLLNGHIMAFVGVLKPRTLRTHK